MALTVTMAENLNEDFWIVVSFNVVTRSCRLEVKQKKSLAPQNRQDFVVNVRELVSVEQPQFA